MTTSITPAPSPARRILGRWPTLVGILAVPVFVFAGTWAWVVGAAVVYVGFGIFRSRRRTWPWLLATFVALAVFAGLNIWALSMDEPWLRYVVAILWFAHGLWDLVHHRADRIAPRWWAELCFVTDVLLAIVIAFFPQILNQALIP